MSSNILKLKQPVTMAMKGNLINNLLSASELSSDQFSVIIKINMRCQVFPKAVELIYISNIFRKILRFNFCSD